MKHGERIWIFPETAEKNHDDAPLFCDLYVIDLQQEKLVMFVGRQMQPQEKNAYGAAGERYSGIKEAYYACRLCVMFSFRYIRTFSSEEISGDMERTVESRERRS